ncbi:MAG: cytochrome c biogenesis protein CcsA [Parachlamydiaceae bacterium]|nr:cytochrome c biogenesis protein CcsA [Parachlamydiaceae bacterium]
MRLIFSIVLSLFISFIPLTLSAAFTAEIIPIAYKGRIRPADAYAQLWLYEIYHSKSLKKQDLTQFNTNETSPLSWLWSLHFFGSDSYKNAPLFWVQSKELKELAGFDLKQSHFSYNDLYSKFYQDKATSNNLIKPLIIFHALKSFQDPANRSHSEKLELTKLARGLWIHFTDNNLVITSTPKILPWSHLAVGQTIASNVLENAKNLMATQKTLADTITDMITNMQQFKALEGIRIKEEKDYKIAFEQMRKQKVDSKEIEKLLEKQYPLLERLRKSGTILQALPSRYPSKEWFSLHALKTQIYQPASGELGLVTNFTLYSNADFENIRIKYLEWEQSVIVRGLEESIHLQEQVFAQLRDSYQHLLESGIQKKINSNSFYQMPSLRQLKIESFYYNTPLIMLAIILYGIAGLAFIFGGRSTSALTNRIAFILLGIAFLFHTFILGLRCYILERPPVSNMFETVIYVPWIAVALSLLLKKLLKSNVVVVASCIVSLILLALIQVTDMNNSLENVQPVLNSQFWLIIHVLMVVGSYGVFILGGVLGHLYLFSYLFSKNRSANLNSIGNCILQTLYIGTALLVAGTILGGVWAAESWGRFWDWDPKESWAFISICIYLVVIHAYRFNKIAYFGLSQGAILGLLAISFTWYGVNYILGTGLHSYGFGHGGQYYYYLFLLCEVIFLSYCGLFHMKRVKIKEN